MFSKSKKMLALVCPPVDSDSSDENEENRENDLTLVITPHEIDWLLKILDEDVQNEVNTIVFFIHVYR